MVIKSFKLFESTVDIESDINNIFLSEIKDEDDRYDIEIYDFNDVLGSFIEDKITVEISKWSFISQNSPTNRTLGKRITFNIEDIEDGIHRIINYMTDIGYNNNYITTKLRSMDYWKELVMKEGDYTRYKSGPNEWRFDGDMSRIKITFKRK